MMSAAQSEPSSSSARVNILARLVPIVSLRLPLIGRALCAVQLMRLLEARRNAETAGVSAKLSRAIALLFCLGSCFSVTAIHGQDLSKFDLSTNDGVNAAREAIAGKPLDDRSKLCIRRDKTLPGITIVGGFAYDYGCRLQGAFINSQHLTSEDKAFSRTALEALGWKADPSQRKKTAQAWVAKGLLAFLTVISVKDADFANHSFQPPLASIRPDGSIAVTLWIRLPSGRVRGTRYELREYRFSGEGDLAGTTTLENFTAPAN